MVILLLFVSVVLFVLADLGVREAIRRVADKRRRREREDALKVCLNLDFTREARTLKRVEVNDPVARILCVDDEEVILSSFRKILVLDGYNVDTVETGQEALGLIQTHHYDFVFTDLKMPSMNGVDVVKSVRHMRPDIDVVVITGYASVDTAVECLKHGAMDYIQKPFTADELLAFVKKALLKRRDRVEKQLQPTVHITHSAEAEKAGSREFNIPGGVLISKGHTWASLAQDGTVKVGLDDFAKKLIGPIDGVEFPNVGMTVKAGQPLFRVRQKKHSVQFHSPAGGKVVRVNAALGEDLEALEATPYHKNWVCELEGDNLEIDVPALRIGRSAVALFQEDIARFRASAKGLSIGELQNLDDGQRETIARDFFRP